jgi:hypothetical protein
MPESRASIPRRMPVEEIAGIIDKCLDESSNKKNSVFSRETISRDQIMKSAEDLARIINGSLETEEGQKTMSYDDLARFLMASCSADNVIFLDDDEQQDPLQEDDLDIWRGLPQQKLSTSQVPAVAQVCSAISELSSTLGDLETTFTKKMEQFIIERPEVSNHVSTLKADLSDMIQALSGTLGNVSIADEKDVEAAIDNELHNWETRRIKEEFIREERHQVEQLNKSKKRQKELEENRSDEIETMEEKRSIALPPTAAGRKSEVGDNRKSVRRSRADGNRTSTTERSGSIIRRRKTSTGRRVGSSIKLKIPDDRVDAVEKTPEGSVTKEEYLLAAVENRPKTLQKFIDQGGAVNTVDECKRSALHRAALYGSMDCVTVLSRNKVKMNLQDKLGDTALHWACRGGDLQIVKYLVDNGAKVNAKDKLFSTPLHVAVRVGVQEIIEFLCEHGADINAKDREGDTPMHDAVRLGRYRIVKSLILYGANLRVKNQQGKTPVDMVQLWYKDTAQALSGNTEARKKNSVAVKMTDLINEQLAAGQ